LLPADSVARGQYEYRGQAQAQPTTTAIRAPSFGCRPFVARHLSHVL
jgi:hypothetical protein